MDEQRRVAEFIASHDLAIHPAHRTLDLVSEAGEVAKAVNESTGYGASGEVHVPADELGDVLFAVLALATAVEIDAGAALDTAIEKYAARLERSGGPGSG